MTARSTYVIVCALIVSLVHCAELSNVQNQLRSFLNTDMVDTAKAGKYISVAAEIYSSCISH